MSKLEENASANRRRARDNDSQFSYFGKGFLLKVLSISRECFSFS